MLKKLSVLLSFCCSILLATQGYSTSTAEQPVIVQLEEGADPAVLAQRISENSPVNGEFYYVRKVSKRQSLHLYHFKGVGSEAKKLIPYINSLRGVSAAFIPHRLESRSTEPDDPFYANQWHMDIINAPMVWDITTGGSTEDGQEIVIALMDYGFQVDHPDLIDNIWTNPGEVPDDGIDNDGNGYTDDYLGLNVQKGNDDHPQDFHGTGTAGILGAKGNNGLGVSGINWNVKILLFSPMEYTYHVTEALEYCMDLREKYNSSGGSEGAFIVATSLSLGVPSAFPESSVELGMWCELYDEAGELGILNAVAAPNANVDIGLDGDMPSLCPGISIISVTNSDRSDRKVIDAGYNAEFVDLAAPGDESYTTDLRSEYREFGGCSASTPHVAGAIGLLYSLPFEDFVTIINNDPSKAALLVREAIMEGTEPLSTLENVTVTGGRLDLFGSMEKLREKIIADQLGDKDLELLGLSPNPADREVTVSFRSRQLQRLHADVYNLLGQRIYSAQVIPEFGAESEFTILVDGWAPGTYFLSLRNRSETLKSTFVVH